MFEDVDGFENEYVGESKDRNFYCDSVPEFQMLIKYLQLDEVGISFSGEIEVDDKTSVITDNQIKLENPEVAAKTYQKVMEMRDLSRDEINHINKFRLFFKKLFEVFFNNQKFRVYYTSLWLVLLTFEVATDDYLMALFYVAAIALYNSPIKFAKELKKMFGSRKRKEQLKEELSKVKILGYVNSVPDDDGVQLYFRPKGN